MGEYQELFKFAAKAGALEGYLYDREEVEPLEDWMGNIEKMHAALPDAIKADIRSQLRIVLARAVNHGEKVLQNKIRDRLENLLATL